MASAASRLSASTTMMPARNSLVSMNGPSVSSVRPSPFRTVVADSSACSRAQPVTQGLASTSAIAAATGPAWVRWLP